MNKIVKILAAGIAFLTVVCLCGFLAIQLNQGSRILGPLSGIGKRFFTFPALVGDVLGSQEVRGVPRTYLPLNDGTEDQNEAINNLDYDLFGVLSRYSTDEGAWKIDLVNLRNQEQLYSWAYGKELFQGGQFLSFDEAQVKHPLPLPDSSLVLYSRESANMIRLSPASRLMWRNEDFIYHHSISQGLDGNIWACGSLPGPDARATVPLNYVYRNPNGDNRTLRDDRIVLIDLTTGETLFDRGVVSLLIDAGYAGVVFGTDGGHDPIHLNDIEPVLEDGRYWKRGDLILSIRDRSILLHYRPSSDKIIRLIQGPFVHQHDVDIQGDSLLSVFNNNYGRVGKPTATSRSADHTLPASNIMLYDYGRDSFYLHPSSIMTRDSLYTPTGGVHTQLPNGDLFVDLDDFGRLLIFRGERIIYRAIFPTKTSGYKHITNWTRVYPTNPLQ